MPQTELKAIIRKMIMVELNARTYYLKAVEAMQDEGAIFNFTLLADEETEHARSFYQLYPGDDLPSFEEMLAEAEDNSQVLKSVDVELMARLDERQVLELALKLEKEVEENLRRMQTEIKSPAARAVVEKNVESTALHYEIIAIEYTRLYGDLVD